jgi:hypothetical protein
MGRRLDKHARIAITKMVMLAYKIKDNSGFLVNNSGIQIHVTHGKRKPHTATLFVPIPWHK